MRNPQNPLPLGRGVCQLDLDEGEELEMETNGCLPDKKLLGLIGVDGEYRISVSLFDQSTGELVGEVPATEVVVEPPR